MRKINFYFECKKCGEQWVAAREVLLAAQPEPEDYDCKWCHEMDTGEIVSEEEIEE